MTSTKAPDDGWGPLAGLTVIEMGNFIAAPTAGKLLAEFGADVIKIERPHTGDELRAWRRYDGDTSLLFRLIGRNKRSITLDLRTIEGADIARRLVRDADVLLENFRPGTLERWGLGPDELHALNPRLIVTRISGYGQSGPYRDNPGFGGVAEAMSGIRHLTGYLDRPPVRVGVSLADTVAGLYAVIGTLLALMNQGRNSTASEVVDVALYEAVYSMTESLVSEYDAFGINRGPTGSAIPGIVPSNSYRCKDDSYVVVGGNNDAIFQRFMRAIDRHDLAEAAHLQDNHSRVQHATEIEDAIDSWTSTRTQQEVLDILRDASVPCGPIFTAADIADDPHYEQRGMRERHRVQIAGDRVEDVAFPGVVPKLSSTPGQTRWMGPELGAHTDDVLSDLGIGEHERASLRESGVI